MGVLVVMVIGMGSFCGREAADEVRCSGEEEQEEHSNTWWCRTFLIAYEIQNVEGGGSISITQKTSQVERAPLVMCRAAW